MNLLAASLRCRLVGLARYLVDSFILFAASGEEPAGP